MIIWTLFMFVCMGISWLIFAAITQILKVVAK